MRILQIRPSSSLKIFKQRWHGNSLWSESVTPLVGREGAMIVFINDVLKVTCRFGVRYHAQYWWVVIAVAIIVVGLIVSAIIAFGVRSSREFDCLFENYGGVLGLLPGISYRNDRESNDRIAQSAKKISFIVKPFLYLWVCGWKNKSKYMLLGCRHCSWTGIKL